MKQKRELPQSIHASVHADAIKRVSRFFNATPLETFNELFQNARRSGASLIDVTIENHRVTVADDGAGIQDPTVLLAFGQSGWNQETNRREDPAGMGIYSLARQENVTICSQPTKENQSTEPWQGWRIQLREAHFLGQQAAPVEPTDHGNPGTEIGFDNDRANPTDVQSAARHFPLPVFLHHEGTIKEMEHEDFLQNAVRIEEWRGLRIGVFRREPTDRPQVNFHGMEATNADLPEVYGINTTWRTKVDVMDCPELELVLPARKEIVETAFMNELRTVCRQAIYRAMLEHETPVDVSVEVRQDAAALGIDLPVARPMLHPWAASDADEHSYHNNQRAGRRTIGQDAIVMSIGLPVCDQQMLQRALQRAGMQHRLYSSNDQFTGYDWYDRLTKATNLNTVVTVEGTSHSLTRLRQNWKLPKNCRPESIALTLHTRYEADEQVVLELPSDIAFGEPEHESRSDDAPVLIVTADSTISSETLIDITMDTYFSASEDCEADSYETQKDDYREIVESAALRILESEEESIRSAILNSVCRHVTNKLPAHWSATITIKPKRSISLTIQRDTETAPEVTRSDMSLETREQ